MRVTLETVAEARALGIVEGWNAALIGAKFAVERVRMPDARRRFLHAEIDLLRLDPSTPSPTATECRSVG